MALVARTASASTSGCHWGRLASQSWSGLCGTIRRPACASAAV